MIGLQNGMVMQRVGDTADIMLYSEEGEILSSSLGQIERRGDGVRLFGIPTGGPYTLTLTCARACLTFTDLYVGDVFILAGQSNMEGAGILREQGLADEEDPDPAVRAYYMKEAWDAARPQLHQLWESADACISVPYREERLASKWGASFPERQMNGVGPGFYFARELHRRTGIPLGVIPCAIGGSSLAQWEPSGKDNFYTAMMRRFRACGSRVRGVFWHQGESECSSDGCAKYTERMMRLVCAMREAFGDARLPFVYGQIHHFTLASGEGEGFWSTIREEQRALRLRLPHCEMIPTNDADKDDLIHLSAESQEVLGRRAAEQMHRLLTGEGVPTPDVERIELAANAYRPFWCDVLVTFRNTVGSLVSQGVPSGFSLHGAGGERVNKLQRILLEGERVRLQTECSREELAEMEVSFGYGSYYYCNIGDEGGRCLPSFGPLAISEEGRNAKQTS